jgi:hypothetical protein
LFDAARYLALNKERHRRHVQKYRAHKHPRIRATIKHYRETHPCVDCGETDISVLQFDHRNPALKKFNISQAVAISVSLKTLIAEIAKCDMRCIPCHKKRTREQHRNGEIFGKHAIGASAYDKDEPLPLLEFNYEGVYERQEIGIDPGGARTGPAVLERHPSAAVGALETDGPGAQGRQLSLF